MGRRLPRLMDSNGQELMRLHPLRVQLSLNLTPLSTADMTLVCGDAPVQVGQLVELYRGEDSAGIYRITSVRTALTRGATVDVHMEHAVVTIGDTVLPGYTELGGVGMPTGQVIAALLAKQRVPRWALGDCDYVDTLSYSWENENLLTALLSTATHLTDAMWDFDMSSTPWRLHLRRMTDNNHCECRMSRNINRVSINIDQTSLCTRIIPLGFGEGADQLTIRDANGGDIALTADTAATWGIVETVYTDTSITDPVTLKAAGLSVLARAKNPTVSVELDADELHQLTGDTIDRFFLGRLCLLPLNDYGVVMRERVIGIQYPNLLGEPARVKVTLANRDRSAVQDIASLSRKSAISELYSQGAATHFEIPFADNADPEHPAKLRFYIDRDAIHVNAVKVKFDLEPFRGYSKANTVAGGGGVIDDISISENGVDTSGAETKGIPFSQMGTKNIGTAATMIVSGDSHTHDVIAHMKTLDHTHYVSLVPIANKLKIRIAPHSHPTNFGIYEGGTAGSVVVRVDGQTVPVTKPGEFDALPYLAKDDQGKIKRGAWHEVTFTPDGLTRITASLYVRTFIRSLTGANL